jgi:hypothetical protein
MASLTISHHNDGPEDDIEFCWLCLEVLIPPYTTLVLAIATLRHHDSCFQDLEHIIHDVLQMHSGEVQGTVRMH